MFSNIIFAEKWPYARIRPFRHRAALRTVGLGAAGWKRIAFDSNGQEIYPRYELDVFVDSYGVLTRPIVLDEFVWTTQDSRRKCA